MSAGPPSLAQPPHGLTPPAAVAQQAGAETAVAVLMAEDEADLSQGEMPWHAAIARVKERKLMVGVFLEESRLARWEGGALCIAADDVHKSFLSNAENRELIESSLGEAYGKIVTDGAPVYRHPAEALAGWPPVRVWEKGFVFVSLIGETTVQGRKFYQINRDEFMRAEDVTEVQPSRFQGAFFPAPPGTAVGWIIHNVQLSAAPGQPPAPDAPWAGRYQFFQVLGAQTVGEWNWYLVGSDMWVEQREVALVQPTPPPGAGPDVIAVDTYEQTLGFYQGGQLVYAALVSSGSRYFPTRPGAFKVWAKLTHGKMSGAYRADRSDYYFLEDVPWILYYDGARALHGAYWHDKFGARSSHGCVNLSPLDARWLFDHAGVGATVVVFSSGEG